jgi:NAD(P)H-nitrite reductase large subunit
MAMVCSCHVVTERRIVKAIDRGARSIDAVSAACGAGATCHGCHDAIDGLICARAGRSGPTLVTVRVA